MASTACIITSCPMYMHFCTTQAQDMSEEKVVHCSMDTLDTYVYQLKINNAISACDDVLRVFVVQDFSTNNLSLKVKCEVVL